MHGTGSARCAIGRERRGFGLSQVGAVAVRSVGGVCARINLRGPLSTWGWLRDRQAIWLLALLLGAFGGVVGALYGAYSLGLHAGRQQGHEDFLRVEAVLERLPVIQAMADSVLRELPRQVRVQKSARMGLLPKQ
jgi:hypothetical protein